MSNFAAGAGGGCLLERAAELSALDRALATVRSGQQGRIVLVAGEAGIGKTALLRQFTASAAASALAAISRKLGVRNRESARAAAQRLGLVTDAG